MKKVFTLPFCILVCVAAADGQSQLQATIGGSDADYTTKEGFRQTTDGGYIFGGSTYGFGACCFYTDGFLVKTNAAGAVLWAKVFGGTDHDGVGVVYQTTDGGYLATYSESDMVTFMPRPWYLLKFDANGSLQWAKDYGYTGTVNSMIRALDGNYMCVGAATVSGNTDMFVMKIDVNGNFLWGKRYGGTGNTEDGRSIMQTSDGGFVMGGQTWSFSGNTYSDLFMVKVASDGALQWGQSFGGTNNGENFGYVVAKSAGGYILIGDSYSFMTGAGPFSSNIYVINTDANGVMLWSERIGANSTGELTYSAIELSTGGFLVSGWTNTYGVGGEAYMININGTTGAVSWFKTYGGASSDYIYAVREIAGGLAFGGLTNSFGSGSFDIFLGKTDGSGTCCANGAASPAITSTTAATRLTSPGPLTSPALIVSNITLTPSGTAFYAVNAALPSKTTVCVALPVELVSFKGRKEGNAVVLEWETAGEKYCDYFEVESSADGVNFMPAGTVKGAGNTTTGVHYSFTDPLTDDWRLTTDDYIYYRLHQVDFDGNGTYSEIVSLFAGNITDLELHVISLGTDITVQGVIPAGSGEVRLSLYDVAGKLMCEQSWGTVTGVVQRKFDRKERGSGIYHMCLSTGNGSTTRETVIFTP